MKWYTALFIIIFSPTVALAQLDSFSMNQASAIEIELKPTYPEPGEMVVASLNDYRSSTQAASITWSYQGTNIGSGREVTFQAGKLGVNSTLTATLVTDNGIRESYTKTIRPLYIDLIVEAQTHVPDFYQGRALPSPGSVVNLTTLIDGLNTSSNNLLYTWRVNNEAIDGGPVRGGNKSSFTIGQDTRTVVSLSVSTLSGETVAQKGWYIPSVNPNVYFYETHPLYGVIPKVLSSYTLIGNSVTLRAEPYHLDSRVYNSPDIHQWQLGNNMAQSDANPYEITLERTGGSGRTTLEIKVRSLSNLLQGGSKELLINY